jgi:hypothetical protein
VSAPSLIPFTSFPEANVTTASMNTNVRLDLNSEDAAIVGLALLGRLPDEAKERAREINKQIVLAKLVGHRQHLHNIKKILEEHYPEELGRLTGEVPLPRSTLRSAAARNGTAATR